jgi:hypothetical protein
MDFLSNLNLLGDSNFWFPVYRVSRALFLMLDVVLFVGLVFAISKGLPFRPKLAPHTTSVKRTFTLRDALAKERWEDIAKRAAAGSPDLMKLAIIEADKLVDDTLKRLGLQGEHMADRLQQVRPEEIRSLNALWAAHRLRNELVHTPGFSASPEEFKKALAGYEAFLREVKVL